MHDRRRGASGSRPGVDELLPTDDRGVVVPDVVASLSWSPAELAPGDAVCIAGLTPHYSEANKSAAARRVLVASYAPAGEGYDRERYYAAREQEMDAGHAPGTTQFRISTLADFEGIEVARAALPGPTTPAGTAERRRRSQLLAEVKRSRMARAVFFASYMASSAWRTSSIGSVSVSHWVRATPTLASSGTRTSWTGIRHCATLSRIRSTTVSPSQLWAWHSTTRNSSPPRRPDDVALVGGLHERHAGGEDGGVAHLVAVGVVQGLEPVEVDEQHRHGLARLAAPAHVVGEELEHRGAVLEPRERVVGGRLVQQLALELALADPDGQGVDRRLQGVAGPTRAAA